MGGSREGSIFHLGKSGISLYAISTFYLGDVSARLVAITAQPKTKNLALYMETN
jgi:hypothetical protein